jgi:hypothetical protein
MSRLCIPTRGVNLLTLFSLTRLSLSLPSNDNAYIQQFPFNAAGFGGKCSTANILSELCDCSKYDASSVKHGTVLCYECYTKSFYISGSNTQVSYYPSLKFQKKIPVKLFYSF